MPADILRETDAPTAPPSAPPESEAPTPRATPFDATASQIQSVYGGVLGARSEQQAGLERKAAAVNPRLTAVQTATDDFAKQIQEHRAELEASKPQITRPPARGLSQYLAPHEGESPEASVGKLISGLTMFATGLGGLAKGDATAGLAAFKGALQGWHEGDKERADRAFADWKAKTDAALKQWEVERTSYQDWIEAGNMSLDQMLKGAELEAIKHDNLNAAKAFGAGTMEGALGFLQGERNHADSYAATMAKIVESKQRHEDAVAEQTRRREETERHNKELESIAKRKEALKQKDREGSQYDDDTLNDLADRLIAGENIRDLVRGTRPEATRAAIEVQRRASAKLRAQGKGPEAITLASRSLAANRAALVDLTKKEADYNSFLSSFESAAKNTLRLAESAKLGDTPVFNKWIVAGRKATGDSSVKNFDAQIDILAQEMARVTTRQRNTTVEARDHAREILNSALTLDQLKGLISEVLEKDAQYGKAGFAEQKTMLENAIGRTPAPAAKAAAENDPLGIRR